MRAMAEGREPRFDIDYERGRQGELLVAGLIEALKTERVEVKRDDVCSRTGNVYVEYQCLRGGAWRRSGIATTQAETWAFVLAGGEVVVALATSSLLEVARRYWRKGQRYRRQETDGSHPTKGVVIPIGDLVSRGTSAGRPGALDRHLGGAA